ncbi:hypothetical protein vseg_011950 [Gypsophila vaccaria]
MDVFKTSFVILVVSSLIFAMSNAQSSAPAPAPAPSSDGSNVDQGIAYVLMMVALALTYLIH